MMAKRSAADSVQRGGHGSSADAQRVLEEYLSELRTIRSTGAGVPETSYYPALSNLFNAVGSVLKPRVRCLIHPQDEGAGIPDGGLFTADQFERRSGATPDPGQLPARGAIEVKGTKREVAEIAKGPQVERYVKRYGIVIATNLRDFLILERGPSHQPVTLESFAIAGDEDEFWRDKVGHPRATAQQIGKQFIEFITRACLHAAPLANPKDVAWFLASYARDALARVEQQRELPALQAVRVALEEALGMKFAEEKGEHFFRSTLVQTLFYGVFSAWVLWHRENPRPEARFDWKKAEWSLHVPFIRTLYEEVAKPSRLGPLGLVEVLDWTAAVLNRVDRQEFFQQFQDEQAVQYFYEPFLDAYDPELRKELGVWYTPREVVKYQVARVDTVLREELDLPDGLADPNVIVLDPCCGTGAYLVEVLHCIATTLRDKGGDALVASDLKTAAMQRVFGFEILPAPFVVSHLQLGLMLRTEGAPLSHGRNERVGVYLTNALTGWESPKGAKATLPLPYPELQEERDAAEEVKRKRKILVILGNPPYNAFAGVSPEEEQGIVEPYKHNLNRPASAGGWGIKKFNLDDLYVRFFRLAERRIAEMTGRGVISFISNFSYLGDPSFVIMRQRFLAEFDKLWLDCLNGDSRETGKLTPEGEPDPSVFSTEYNREGIRVGTAVCVIVRKAERQKKPVVRFRHLWGVTKRTDLLKSVSRKRFSTLYTLANPCPDNRYSFRPEDVAEHYTQWPRIPDLCTRHFNGPVERRGNSLIVMEKKELLKLHDYLDASKSDDEIAVTCPAFMKSSGEFKAQPTRIKLKGRVAYSEIQIARYPFKPMDVRYAYLDAAIQPLFSRPSPELLAHTKVPRNHFFITRDTADKTPEGPPFYFASVVCDYDSISGHARHFPALLSPAGDTAHENGLLAGNKPHANLSKTARAYLAKLGISDPDADAETAGLIWMHALAIGYSPAYLTENADGIRRDWPRIPLPRSKKAIEASAALGERVAALLDSETDVPGITSGRIGPMFKTIGPITKVDGGAIDPAGTDLAVTAGWGHAGKGGVTMPGRGNLSQRRYDDQETEAMAAEASLCGMAVRQMARLLGSQTCDVYLNGKAYWRNIPASVWDYYIGGYQVIKKWLSYREHDLLARPLTPDEVREVTDIARRLTALILLQPALDENYRRVKGAAYDWPGATGSSPPVGAKR